MHRSKFETSKDQMTQEPLNQIKKALKRFGATPDTWMPIVQTGTNAEACKAAACLIAHLVKAPVAIAIASFVADGCLWLARPASDTRDISDLEETPLLTDKRLS